MRTSRLFIGPVFALLISFCFPNSGSAADLSQVLLGPEELFRRCYAHLTGLQPAPGHALLSQVKTGSLDPVEACMQVLSKAVLAPIAESDLSAQQKQVITPANPAVTYAPYTVRQVSDPEAVAVLNRFYNFHRMFFAAKDFSQIPAFYWLNDRFNDPTEGAVYLTRLLFQQGAQYRDVVTGNYSVRAIRSLGAWVRTYYTGGSDRWNLQIGGTGLERGLLWGVGAYAPLNKTWLADDGSGQANFHATYYNNSTTFQSQRAYGGGIMGLSSYVMMNTGFPNIGRSDDPNYPNVRSTLSNATFRMHRRLMQNVLNDLFCRSLPVLRSDDVAGLVTDYLANYPNSQDQVAFRVSNSCMGCHASIDPMAATMRSLFFYHTDNINWLTPSEVTQSSGQTTNPAVAFVTIPSLWSTFTSIRPPETPAHGEYSNMARDSRFYERPGTGSLRMRLMDGTLYWQTFTAQGELDGLSKMGAAMAELDDLYACAASRYFEFFTGIKVSLQDIGDVRNTPLSADDTYYRNVVLQLGRGLKQHQSLYQLVRNIFDLSLYRKRGMRDRIS